MWDDGADPDRRARADDGSAAGRARSASGAPRSRRGESLANLRRAFVPIWLLHRYQIEAAAKSLGGVDFPYALNREGYAARTGARAGPAMAALYALIDTLSPAELTVPPQLMPLLSAGFGGNSDRQTDIEIIPTAGGPVFDPLEATEVGAAQTLERPAQPAAAEPARNPACEPMRRFPRPRQSSIS